MLTDVLSPLLPTVQPIRLPHKLRLLLPLCYTLLTPQLHPLLLRCTYTSTAPMLTPLLPYKQPICYTFLPFLLSHMLPIMLATTCYPYATPSCYNICCHAILSATPPATPAVTHSAIPSGTPIYMDKSIYHMYVRMNA